MKKVKQILIFLVVLGVIAGAVFAYLSFQNWTVRFASELDRFFGKGNWECIDEESKTSHMYTEYHHSSSSVYSEETPGRYKNWDILFTKADGTSEVWTITNHTLKINHSKRWLLSPKRYSAKQALVLELMDISH